MLAWLSGSGEPLSNESDHKTLSYDDTSREEPETPVPVFAMRAFKQAIFGTPQLKTPAPSELSSRVDANQSRIRRLQPSEKQKLKDGIHEQLASRAQVEMTTSEAQPRSPSPTRPSGILLTPGTINGKRKQVKFGEQVLDNEGKQSKYSRSGLPNDCPGKFPSPWTPKTITSSRTRQSVATAAVSTSAAATDAKVVESSVASLKTATKATEPVRIQSKDDVEITSDVTLPQSASGRYWKTQYEQFSANSVVETKRLIAKHKLAKDYARLKDDEADGLRSQLDYEQKKRTRREGSLEVQVKQLRERLRDALADNAKLTAEVSAFRLQLEQSTSHNVIDSMDKASAPQSSAPPPNAAAQIENSKDAVDVWLDQDDDSVPHPRTRRLRRSPKNEQLKQDLFAPVAKTTTNESALPTRSPRRLPRPAISPRASRASPLSERSPNLPMAMPSIENVKGSQGLPAAGSPVPASAEKSVLLDTPASARTRHKTVSIEGRRLDDAKARVAERRRMKRTSRSNVGS